MAGGPGSSIGRVWFIDLSSSTKPTASLAPRTNPTAFLASWPQILESEGDRQAKINVAEARKAEVILASEASKLDQINRAEGEATMSRISH